MAMVTIELRNLLKTDFDLFDFNYQFDDKKFKEELEQAVINFYYNYEIGQETPEDFKRVFKNRWLSAIGYYNKLHNTTLLEYNPLINHKMSEALEQLATSSSKENTESNTTTEDQATISNTSESEDKNTFDNTTNLDESSNTRSQGSDYPQQPIAGDYKAEETNTDNQIDSTTSNFGTNTTNSTNSSSGTTNTNGSAGTTGELTSTGEQNTNYEKTIEGLTGITYQELIQKERENLIRITGNIIEELKPCFILVH